MTNANKLYILFCRWVWGGCASILRIKRGDGRDNYCVGVQQREGPVVSPLSREKGTAERSSSGRDTYKRSSNSPSSIRNSCAAETAPPSGDPKATGSFSRTLYRAQRHDGKEKGIKHTREPAEKDQKFPTGPAARNAGQKLGARRSSSSSSTRPTAEDEEIQMKDNHQLRRPAASAAAIQHKKTMRPAQETLAQPRNTTRKASSSWDTTAIAATSSSRHHASLMNFDNVLWPTDSEGEDFKL